MVQKCCKIYLSKMSNIPSLLFVSQQLEYEKLIGLSSSSVRVILDGKR